MMGHSDLETTKIYINEIDRKQDVYNNDYAEYMLKMKDGVEVEISNSPMLSIRWEDFREILSKCFDMAKDGEEKFEVINRILGMAEKRMI